VEDLYRKETMNSWRCNVSNQFIDSELCNVNATGVIPVENSTESLLNE
jgi:hypothetical protein